MNVKVIVAAHKPYKMPTDDMYLPVHVGAKGKAAIGYIGDNTGENISEKNPFYCELTGLYWAWKNLEADYLGLAHYRRHFKGKQKSKDKFDCILSGQETEEILKEYKIIVPKKRKYYIESLYSHYAHTHYAEHLDAVESIIKKKFPEYLLSYTSVMKHTYGHMFNMMIMKREYSDAYCQWLFTILLELEEMVDEEVLSDFQKRLYGRVSEILLNVWLDYQIREKLLTKQDVKEVPCIHMENINWVKKGISFLRAKFLKNKYESSF